MPITQTEYWDEIKRIVVDSIDEAREFAPGDENRFNESIWQIIDGHQWIIYNHYHTFVLQHSRNENTYFDEFGALANVDSFSEVTVRLAFAAMHQDVWDEMPSNWDEQIQEDWEEEDDEDE
jgi:hypothetical protein